LHAMFMCKLKVVIAVVVGVSILGLGAGGIWQVHQGGGQAVAQQPQNTPQPRTKPALSRSPDQVGTTEEQPGEQQRNADRQKQLAMQQQLQALETKLEQVRAQYEVVRQEAARLERMRKDLVQQILQGGKNSREKTTEDPNKRPTPSDTPMPANRSANIPAAASALPALPAGASTDFIHVGTAYIDALRDVEVAKAMLSGNGGVSDTERLVYRANLVAAERKAGLLRSIIEGSLKEARATEERVQKLASRNYISGEERSRAESNVRLLQLILDSAK